MKKKSILIIVIMMILTISLATFILLKNNNSNKNNDLQDKTIYETLKKDSKAENVTQKIMNDNFFSSGKITKIDDDYIYFLNDNNKLFYIEKL